MRSMNWLLPALVVGLFVALSNRSAAADGPASQPSAATGTLVVNVVDGDGNAVAGAHVTVMTPLPGEKHAAVKNSADPFLRGQNPKGPTTLGSMGHSRPVAHGTTDDKGSVTFSDIKVGNYHVAAWGGPIGTGFTFVTVMAGETETVTVTIGHPKSAQPGTNP
jgi:hypothetical protein